MPTSPPRSTPHRLPRLTLVAATCSSLLASTTPRYVNAMTCTQTDPGAAGCKAVAMRAAGGAPSCAARRLQADQHATHAGAAHRRRRQRQRPQLLQEGHPRGVVPAMLCSCSRCWAGRCRCMLGSGGGGDVAGAPVSERAGGQPLQGTAALHRPPQATAQGSRSRHACREADHGGKAAAVFCFTY